MRVFSNLALQTKLTSGVSDTATTLPVGSTSGWPDPEGGDVALAAINYGNPSALEIVSYSGKTETSLTGVVRGIDDTTARVHNAEARVVHTVSAKDIERVVGAEFLEDGSVTGAKSASGSIVWWVDAGGQVGYPRPAGASPQDVVIWTNSPSQPANLGARDIWEGGQIEHDTLTGKDAANQHPIGAITGLQTALDNRVSQSGLNRITQGTTAPSNPQVGDWWIDLN